VDGPKKPVIGSAYPTWSSIDCRFRMSFPCWPRLSVREKPPLEEPDELGVVVTCGVTPAPPDAWLPPPEAAALDAGTRIATASNTEIRRIL
jgi:hypothetical protein